MITIIYFLTIAIIIYFIALSVGYTVLLMFSFRDTYNSFLQTAYTNSTALLNQMNMVPVSVIMPAYNAEKIILNSIYSVLQSEYQNLNCIVVNDASTDKTMELLTSVFELYEVPPVIKQTLETVPIRGYYRSQIYPNLYIVDKEHSGSADTVHAGLNACQTPLYITVDSDTVIEPRAITNMIFTFLSNPHTIVVGGAMYIINECEVEKGVLIKKHIPTRFIPAQQSCEYLRSFLYGRTGWEQFGGTLCYPGAFTMLETQAVFDAGGYETNNYSYDAEIIMKLHSYMRSKKYPYGIHFAPNAFGWTEGPSTLKSYWKQRNHWQRGMLRSITQHLNLFFNPRFGIVGLFNFPYYVLFEVFGPVVEFISYVLLVLCWYFEIINTTALFYMVLLAWTYNTFLTVSCIFLNSITFNTFRNAMDLANMLSMTILQMFGFRQYQALCCSWATLQYCFNRLRGKPQ